MKKETILKSTLAIIFTISILYTLYLGYQGEKIVFLIIINFILGASLIVASYYKEIFKEKVEEQPKPHSPEDLQKIIEKNVEGTLKERFKDGLFRNIKSQVTQFSISEKEQMIYAFLIELSKSKKIKEKEESQVWITINSNYPNLPVGRFGGSIDKKELIELMKHQAVGYESPETEVIETESTPYETRTKKIRTSPKKKDEDKEAVV